MSEGLQHMKNDKPQSNHNIKNNYNQLSPAQYSRYLELITIDNYFDLNKDDFFLVMSQYNAQAKSRWIEQYIGYNLGIDLISASLDRGDGEKDGVYYEFKTSTTNKQRNLNLRQIRLYQDIEDGRLMVN